MVPQVVCCSPPSPPPKKSQVSPLLRQLDGGPAGESPGSALLHVGGDLVLVFVSQEEEGEAHGGEVEPLQQTGQKLHPAQR